MDAHVFRRVGAELATLLEGARIEKLHGPAEGVLVMTVYATGRKHHVVLRAGRRFPFLFLTATRPQSPPSPPAEIMRLRKYLAGHRIEHVAVDWLARRLLLRVASVPAAWLVLDLREGPQLALDAAPELPAQPVWPTLEQLQQAGFFAPAGTTTGEATEHTTPDRQADDTSMNAAPWQRWPVLTPPLRRVLTALDPLDGGALLVDLEYGGGDLFLYRKNGVADQLSAWPLPPHMRGTMTEHVHEDVLAAATLLGEQLVFADMAASRRAGAAKPHKGEAARLRRLLAKLDEEETRLRRLLDGRASAIALQGQLYRFGAEERLAQVTLPGADGDMVLPLNPLRTVRENMAELFRQSDRGARGLAMLQGRRDAVRQQLAHAEDAAQTPDLPGEVAERLVRCKSVAASSPLPKHVQRFRSSDGFVLLRGRNAEGNAAVLRLGAAHDLWLHAADGPSAHLVIRRDHGAQEIPEITLREAAILVGLRSWQREDAQAHIMCAWVRHVRAVKGAGPGKVRVDRVERTLTVVLDPALEERLLPC